MIWYLRSAARRARGEVANCVGEASSSRSPVTTEPEGLVWFSFEAAEVQGVLCAELVLCT